MYGKRVSGEEMKRGGKEQHSKIGPVNKGEDAAGNAVVCGRGDENRHDCALPWQAEGAREREESCSFFCKGLAGRQSEGM